MKCFYCTLEIIKYQHKFILKQGWKYRLEPVVCISVRVGGLNLREAAVTRKTSLRWEASLWEVLRPTQERLRNILHNIDVNLDGRGGYAAARPSIVWKEIGGTLAWNLGHLPFKVFWVSEENKNYLLAGQLCICLFFAQPSSGYLLIYWMGSIFWFSIKLIYMNDISVRIHYLKTI